MEYSVTTCPGCGSTFIELDYVKKVIICKQCGATSPYTRTALNKNGRVVFALDNAIKCFKEGEFENSANYAHEALNVSNENIPALFIIAYYEEFVQYKNGSFIRFYEKVMRDMMIDGDEMTSLLELFTAAAYNLRNYEKEIMELVRVNMNSAGDAKQLCDFVDKLCPYFIDKRGSCIYLEDDMYEIYKDLARRCSIPKTCYALLKSIGSNPDSPYAIRAKEASEAAAESARTRASVNSEEQIMARAQEKARRMDEAMVNAINEANPAQMMGGATDVSSYNTAGNGLRDGVVDITDARADFFYKHYVMPIGHIINAMGNQDLKNKLMPAYNKVVDQYCRENGIN